MHASRIAIAAMGCLGLAIGAPNARAQYQLTVQGDVVHPAGTPGGEAVGLYTAPPPKNAGLPDHGGLLSMERTDPHGRFELDVPQVTRRFGECTLYVVHEPHDGWGADPQLVHVYKVDDDNRRIRGRIEPLRLARLDVKAPGGAKGAAHAAAAVGLTHRVKAWAGVESEEQADSALRDAVAQVEAPMSPAERAQFTKAFHEAAAPLRKVSADGLPVLASVRSDAFAEELVATAPGRRWQTSPEARRGDALAYREQGGRWEGAIGERVGAATSLVALTDASFSMDPQSESTVELVWSAGRRRPVCLEARALGAGESWMMRAVVPPGKSSFTWTLDRARVAGLERGAVGIVARVCGAYDGSDGEVLPVRRGTEAKIVEYEVAFRSPARLYTAVARVRQDETGMARELPSAPVSLAFDRTQDTPIVRVRIPTTSLARGEVRVEISGDGPYGPFGPEFVRFRHEPEG
jgi:hypothetical protein